MLNIIDTLTEKGVTLISHKENIDTDTPTGKFMLTVFAALSQLEREQLKQRQREGIEIAKAQGVTLCGEWTCWQTPFTAVSGSMKRNTALPSLPLLDSPSDEGKRLSEPSKPAERKEKLTV